MTVSIQGIGWLTKEGYGCVRSGQRRAFESGEDASVLPKKGIFSHPFRNFGRLDATSKSAAYAVALALQDAGREYSPLRKQSVGIVGTNREGSLRTDLEYFQDYIRSGRTLSRANLFIYTLPSSPLGEAAIHFGLLGPLLYAAPARPGLAQLLEMASGMVLGREAEAMLAGMAEEEQALFFVLGRCSSAGADEVCSLDRAREVLASTSATGEIVQQFSLMCARKV